MFMATVDVVVCGGGDGEEWGGGVTIFLEEKNPFLRVRQDESC